MFNFTFTFSEYLILNSMKKMLLCVMNPHKFRATEFLIKYHERRNDKVKSNLFGQTKLKSRRLSSYSK